MSDDYAEWERACRKIREDNQRLLDGFAEWLRGKGLSEKTIKDHLFNVGFYINEYLLYSEPVPVEQGATQIHGFFGDWFIRKAMWASETSMKKTATGLKKFYQYLFEIGRAETYDVQFLRDMIGEDMPEWIATLRKFDSMADDW